MKISYKALVYLSLSKISVSSALVRGKYSTAANSKVNELEQQRKEDKELKRKLNPEYSCFGDHDFTLYFKGECTYDNLVERMQVKTEENARCINSGEEEVQLLVGKDSSINFIVVYLIMIDLNPRHFTHQCQLIIKFNTVGVTDPTDVDIARQRVKSICKTAMDNMATDPTKSVPWEQLSNKGENFDQEFYDGNTFFNEERQTDYDSLIPGEVSNKLSRDGERIDDIYETVLERVPLQWPYHIDNFENCDIRAAMCCWVQDRQANDNNGNCNTPYDDNCVDKDPADNTEICAVDMKRSSNSTKVDDGLMVFRGDDEGDTHCHGIAWGESDLYLCFSYSCLFAFQIPGTIPLNS